MSRTWIRTLGTTLALALIFAGASYAAQSSASKTAPPAKKTAAASQMVSTGTIASIDATHVTINHKVNGKDESTTYVVNPQTKRDTALAAGARVSVRYHKENNELVATSVHAQATTAKAGVAKAKTGAKKG